MTELELCKKELRKRLRFQVLTKEWLERTIISLGIYGRISGVIGPFIIVNVNRVMLIRRRPLNFSMSMTAASIQNRKNMAAATKFARYLKSIDLVYKVWKKAKITGSNAFTKLIRYNKKHLVDDCPSLKNIITPEDFQIYYKNLIYRQKNGNIKVVGDYLPDQNERMIIILTALNPKKKGIEDYKCITLNDSGVEAGRVIKLKSWQKELCSNYRKFIIYSAVIREKGAKLQWSNTSVLEHEFDSGFDYDEAERCGYGQVQSALRSLQYIGIYKSSTLSSGRMVIKPPGNIK